MKLRTLVRKIRKLRIPFVVLSENRDKMNQGLGYNQAIKDVIKFINQEIKNEKKRL